MLKTTVEDPVTMDSDARPYRPEMTQAGLAPTHAVRAVDEYGDTRDRPRGGRVSAHDQGR